MHTESVGGNYLGGDCSRHCSHAAEKHCDFDPFRAHHFDLQRLTHQHGNEGRGDTWLLHERIELATSRAGTVRLVIDKASQVRGEARELWRLKRREPRR